MTDQKVDISELREVLGTITASYTYFQDPFSTVKETDIMIRYEGAMLDAMGRFDEFADKDETVTYRKLLKNFRVQWAKAVSKYNSQTGDWKDSWIDCSEILDNLMRIAVKEGLISVSAGMYNLSQAGMGGLSLAPPEGAGAVTDDKREGARGR